MTKSPIKRIIALIALIIAVVVFFMGYDKTTVLFLIISAFVAFALK
ncbi:hypothetical protein [Lacticaseibacillus brantae]|nr:hypothetical protein [Lacticaseibacillus brantae]